MFKACFVGDVEVDVIVNLDMMRGCSGHASSVEENRVDGVRDCMHEGGCDGRPELAAPSYLVEDSMVLVDKGVVMEEACG